MTLLKIKNWGQKSVPSIKGRTCAFGTKKMLATEAQRTQRRYKSLLGKDLRKVKKILKFPFLPLGYLREWSNVGHIGLIIDYRLLII